MTESIEDLAPAQRRQRIAALLADGLIRLRDARRHALFHVPPETSGTGLELSPDARLSVPAGEDLATLESNRHEL